MNPLRYRDYLIIDSRMDQPIFPKEVHMGINILGPDIFNSYDFSDGYADFSELEFESRGEHRIE